MILDRIVTNEEAEKALNWLRDSSDAIGESVARARKAENMVKHIEALMAKASDEKSAEARKADARTSDEYLEAINEDAFAAGEKAKLYSLREAAALKLEVWRSEQANYRNAKP